MRQHFNGRILGLHLRRWREKYYFTQLDVALHCRVSVATIGKLEKEGYVHSGELFFIICDLIDVDAKEYITEKVG
jgi:transcriptional regulator with XRE-family HTH domain